MNYMDLEYYEGPYNRHENERVEYLFRINLHKYYKIRNDIIDINT